MDDSTGNPHITLRGISKHFGSIIALDEINLEIETGSVHALVGENGAGKSTLGKIISGVVTPNLDRGEMLVYGQPVSYGSPFEALAAGITIISQEIALVPRLTVQENVFLGLESRRAGFFVDNGSIGRRYAELINKTGFSLDPERLVSTLSFAELKQVEILKAIAREAKLIVMDEPTAALPADETRQLLNIIRQLKEDGITIVFVSHFLEEVLEVSDTVTVLRDGVLIQTAPAVEQTPETLVSAMLGREMSLAFPPKQLPPVNAPTLFAVDGLTRSGRLDSISFEIRAGEIVGLAGLVGSGRSELARAIFGADPLDQGQMTLHNRPLEIKSPHDAVKAGMAMLPESRKTQGLLMNFTIGTNLTLPHLESISRAGMIQRNRAFARTAELLQELDVRPPDPDAAIGSLSGGNQQKAMFGKWLFNKPSLLIVDEPTHGVDVGARRSIYQLIVRLAAEGMGIIVISSELEEIIGLSHRVLVMRQGKIVADFTDDPAANQHLSEADIIHAAFATG